ncbi:hypothetical protein PR048_001110, partial [Dryococelus australis]
MEGLPATIVQSCLQHSSSDAASPSVLPQASPSGCVTIRPQRLKIKPFWSNDLLCRGEEVY